MDESFSPKKLKTPKRAYSIDDPLQRMETPVFTKKDQQLKKGPSSHSTVLTMAGLFIVGIMLMMSGAIVLILEREDEFIITGCVFIGVGLIMNIVCAVLQRKNVVKFIRDLDRDLTF